MLMNKKTQHKHAQIKERQSPLVVTMNVETDSQIVERICLNLGSMLLGRQPLMFNIM